MLLNLNAWAQPAATDSIEKTGQILHDLDVKPEFPGGIEAFKAYIADNYKATESGKLKVQYVIEKDGSLSNIVVLEGINKKSDRRIIKLLKKCPKWTPGYQNGKPVRAMYTIPITVKVNKD